MEKNGNHFLKKCVLMMFVYNETLKLSKVGITLLVCIRVSVRVIFTISLYIRICSVQIALIFTTTFSSIIKSKKRERHSLMYLFKYFINSYIYMPGT